MQIVRVLLLLGLPQSQRHHPILAHEELGVLPLFPHVLQIDVAHVVHVEDVAEAVVVDGRPQPVHQLLFEFEAQLLLGPGQGHFTIAFAFRHLGHFTDLDGVTHVLGRLSEGQNQLIACLQTRCFRLFIHNI